MRNKEFQTGKIGVDFVVAPDGSEIRLLHELGKGGLSECTLPENSVSAAICHRSIEEIWLFVQGTGRLWRNQNGKEEITKVLPGVSVTIPKGTHFQFRNDDTKPLKFVISTMPPWPGSDEAYLVRGKWQATVDTHLEK